MTNARRVVMDHFLALMGERYLNNEAAAVNYLIENVLQTTDYVDAERMEFAGVADMTALDQVHRALTEPLSERERNPLPLTYYDTMQGIGNDRYITVRARSFAHAQQEFNRIAMMEPGSGYGPDLERVGTNDGLGFYGNFGDGLPLVPPTEELVAAMLAGSERGRYPDDVLGWLKLQGGAVTVEKVAINAVMAGAKPEHFPVILAAMELMAGGWDYDKMWYHGLSTGSSSTLHIMISGPLGAELGISGAEGSSAGANNEVNNVIGRAIRMCYRNLGHMMLELDDHQYKGREHDHVLIVFREQEEFLPGWDPARWDPANPRPNDMWVPYHVEMGFRPEESTITIWAGNSTGGVQGGEPEFWAQANFGFGNLGAEWFILDNSVDFVAISPGMAQAMYDYRGITSKDMLRNAAPGDVPSRSVSLNPIVSGGDMAPVRFYGGYDFYDRKNHQIQLISGATLTEHGKAASVFTANHVGVTGESVDMAGNPITPLYPSAARDADGAWLPSSPQNIRVSFTPGSISGRVNATLTWDAPASDGNSPIVAYQIAFAHGGAMQSFEVTDTPAGRVNLADQNGGTYVAAPYSMHNHTTFEIFPGFSMGVRISGADRIYTVTAGTAAFNNRTFTLENIPEGYEAFFRVRAISGVRNALEIDGTETIAMSLGDSPMFFWFNDGLTARNSGRGAWGLYDGGRSVIVRRT